MHDARCCARCVFLNARTSIALFNPRQPFELDGGQLGSLSNNIWLVRDDSDVRGSSTPRTNSGGPIVAAVDGRQCGGGGVANPTCHNRPRNRAPELGETLDAPVLCPPAMKCCANTHPTISFASIRLGHAEVAGTGCGRLHTPGHSPGSVCGMPPNWAPCSAETKPCLRWTRRHRRSFSDFPTIRSRSRGAGHTSAHTVVYNNGHGRQPPASVYEIRFTYDEWVARGHDRPKGSYRMKAQRARSVVATWKAGTGCLRPTAATAPSHGPRSPRQGRHGRRGRVSGRQNARGIGMTGPRSTSRDPAR